MRRFLILFCITACSTQEEPGNRISFTEVDAEIDSAHSEKSDSESILEVNGSGMGLFDFDKDGDFDLFVANANAPCRLYENISQDTIKFREVTEKIKCQQLVGATGVAIGDANGDDYDDIYITSHGQNRLLLNMQGDWFEDVTKRANVGDERWGTSARFGDLDGDGDNDLYVCNYLDFDQSNLPAKASYKGEDVFGGPHGLPPQYDVVYENIGDGIFKDVTEVWGFQNKPSFALNASIIDFNNDGHLDVFVGNDSMANYLFLNDGNQPPYFVNTGVASGVAANGDGSMQATMGIGISDVSGNGRADVFTTNFSSDTNTLHLNQVTGFFDDRTKRYGLGLPSRTYLGWTCGFHDFDLDGDDDLYIVNGHVYPNATMSTMDSAHKQAPLLFEREGERFAQIKQLGEYEDRAAVFGDLDNDGDIDIIVAQRSGVIRILRNNADPPSVQRHIVEAPLGARIVIKFTDGTSVTKWFTDGSGFQSSSEPLPIILPANAELDALTVY